MNLNELIKPYKKKLALDAFVRAISFGALLGMISTLIYALILSVAVILSRLALEFNWPMASGFNAEFADMIRDNWIPVAIVAAISLGVGLFVCITLAIAVYVDTYKKGVGRAIKTIDSLGLEERVVTMVEYQQDPSYVAKLQREDAQKHLKEFDAKNIVVKAPKKKIISVISLFLAFTIMLSGVVGAFHVPEFDGIYVNENQWRDDLLEQWEVEKEKLYLLAEELPKKEKDKIESIILEIDAAIKDVINNKDLDKDQVMQEIENIIEEAKKEIDKIIEESDDEAAKDKMEEIKDSLDDAKDEMEDVIEDSKEPAEKDEETFDKIEDIVDKSEISDQKKEEIKEEIKDLEDKFEAIEKDETLTEEEKEEQKKEEAKDTVEKLEEMIKNEKDHVKAIIKALKNIEITKDLGTAMETLFNAVVNNSSDTVKSEAKQEIIDAMNDLGFKVESGFENPFDMSLDLDGFEEAYLKDKDGNWLSGQKLSKSIERAITWCSNNIKAIYDEYEDAYVELVAGLQDAVKEVDAGNDKAGLDIVNKALTTARAKKAFKAEDVINAINTALANAKTALGIKKEENKETFVSALEATLVKFNSSLEGLKTLLNDGSVQRDEKKLRIAETFEKGANEIIDALLMFEELEETIDKIEDELEDRFDEELAPEENDNVINKDDLEDTMDKIEEEIDKSEISDDKKEDLKQEMDKVEEEIKDIINDDKLTDEEKNEAIKDKIDETIKDIEDEVQKEVEDTISLIVALKSNEITKNLGIALGTLRDACKTKDEAKIAEAEIGVRTAMNVLKAGVLASNPTATALINAIKGAIAQTKPADADATVAPSELEKALNNFCTNLEEINTKASTATGSELTTFADEKFTESTNELIKAVKSVESFKDLADEIEKEFDDLIKEDPKEDEEKEPVDKDDLEDTMDKIEEDIDNSEVSDETKEDLKQEMDKVEEEIKDIINDDELTDEEKDDAIKDKVDQTIDDLENRVEAELENILSLIAALKQNEITKELGEAIEALREASSSKDEAKIAEAEAGVRTAMGNLKFGVNAGASYSLQIAEAVRAAVAAARPADAEPTAVMSELETALNRFAANLEAINEKSKTALAEDLKTFVDEKFEKSTTEIINATKSVENLKDLVGDIEDDFEDMFDKEEPPTGEIDKDKVDETIDKIEDDIENSDISEDQKEDLKQEIDKIEDEIQDILDDDKLTPDEKDEAVKDTVDEAIKDMENEAQAQEDNMVALIGALKKNSTTKALGEALEKLYKACQGGKEDEIAKGETAVTAAMNALKNGVLNANPSSSTIVKAIKDAIASTKPTDPDAPKTTSELEKALNNFCTSLEAIQQKTYETSNYDVISAFVDEKFEASTEEIIKAVKSVQSLKDLIDDIEKEFEDMTGEDIETPNDKNENEDEEDKDQTSQDKVDNSFEDIKDTIDNSEMNPEDKDDLNQEMGDLKDTVDDILKDETMTDEEKDQAANDAIRDEQNKLDQEIEQDNQSKEDISENLKDNDLKDSTDETDKEISDALENLGNAIESGDKEQIKDAMDQLENIINGKDPETGENKKDPETGEDIELSDDQKQEIADKIANEIHNAASPSTPSDMRDDLLDFADKLENNKQNAEENGKTFEEQLGETFDKAEQDINDNNAETDTKQEVSDQLGDLREDLVGTTQKETEDMFDDLKNEVSKAPVSDETRNEINNELDKLDKELNDMIQNGASKSEILDKIESSKETIDDLIQSDKDSFLENNTPNKDQTGSEEENPDGENPDGSEDERPSTDSTQDAMDKVNDAIQDANNALDKNDQQGVEDSYDQVDGAFKDLEDQLKNPETGEWLTGDALKEQLGNMAGDFKDMADSLPEGELKDIYEDLSNAFQGAQDKAESGDEQGAIKDAQNALNGAQQKVEGIIGKLEDYKGSQDNINDSFQNAQDNIMGKPSQDQSGNQNDQNGNQQQQGGNQQQQGGNQQQQGGNQQQQGGNQNSDQNSDQNNDQNSDQNNDQNNDQNSDQNGDQNNNSGEGQNKPNDEEPSGGGSSGPSQGTGDDSDADDNYIPGLDMTYDELIASGLLDDALREQYLKDLDEETRRAIENAIASLKGQN